MTNEQKVLMNRLKVCDFVMLETGLFLDSHPQNQEALAFYKKHNEMFAAAKAEYIKNYGPLMANDYTGGDSWNWIDSPWPWEKEAN
ncbi:MAG: spore coat protein CotJB [Hydrogenoanaerobacterium sp.]